MFDGKIPLKPRESNLGSLNHCHPQLPPREADSPERSTAAPQPTLAASGSSVDEDFSESFPPYRCQQEYSSTTFSISTLDLNRYLLPQNFLNKKNF